MEDSSSKRLYVLNHHIYEYRKGLRRLVLFTAVRTQQTYIEERLRRAHIEYYIQAINHSGINVFFGHKACIDVIRSFGCPSLRDLTPEQDFILGTLLGYDTVAQCARYVERVHFQCDRDCEHCVQRNQ